MLHEFVTSNRDELIRRCHDKVARRFAPAPPPVALEHGAPLFLKQLVDTLRIEQSAPASDDAVSVPTPADTSIGRTAALHGADLLHLGYSVDQVVHDYGDICQSVTELAVEQELDITTEEFRTLNRCLDDAIADAVTSFGRPRQDLIDDHAEFLHSSLEDFVWEYHRLVDVALLAYAAMKTGNVGVSGATGNLLLHTLEELRLLESRAMPAIRIACAAATKNAG